mgnify:CR=1 FL=1
MSSAAKEQKHAQALCGSEKGGLMLEMIMKLNIPLYVMTSMGCIGGLGSWQQTLPTERMIRNTQRLQNLKEKMAEPVEVKGQALASDEPICMVSVTVLYISSGTVCFSQQQTGIQGRIVYALSLYRGGSAGSTASSSSGIGLFL